jgi:DNA-directed RNA polymerase I and III subunit RPAC1
MNEEEIIFNIKGIEPPLANALRRILIAEVPTMAIEKVTINQNTTVVPDEVLAHRMGLIPILADPNQFVDKKPDEEITAKNCIKFKLQKACFKDKEGKLVNEVVYSSDLEWVPIGNQKEKLKSIKSVHDSIIILKMRPGQEIDMELYCEKGIGQTHAKWSPVSTAYYRLIPCITIKQPITGELAKNIKKSCTSGVFDIEDGALVMKDSLKCSSCRECIRQTNQIEVAKEKCNYEFHIESVGIITPKNLMISALTILKEKCGYWLNVIDAQKTEGN